MFIEVGRKARINLNEVCRYEISFNSGYMRWYFNVYFRNSDNCASFTCNDEHEAYEVLAAFDAAVGLGSETGRKSSIVGG